MANENKTNTGAKTPIKENYSHSGTQTPVYQKPTPMPPIKPAKEESNNK